MKKKICKDTLGNEIQKEKKQKKEKKNTKQKATKRMNEI